MNKRTQLVDIDLNGNGIYNGRNKVAILYKRSYEIEVGTNELIISNKDYPFSVNDYISILLSDGVVEHRITQISLKSGKIYLNFDRLTNSGLLKIVCSNVGIMTASIIPVNELCFTALEDNSSIGVAQNLSSPVVMYKSSDGIRFETWDYSTINLNSGDKVYLKGKGTTLSTDASNYFQFSMTGKISASGDCTSLTNGVISEYCYYRMFRECVNLVTAPSLPSATLANYCYYGMFDKCSNLSIAPRLSAIALETGCYGYMFASCINLVTAPELPATTLAYACYEYMFCECTRLVTAPELPAINLVGNCYAYMFYKCISLVNAPELPATTLADNCYAAMFYGCISLVNAPKLPATTLSDYCYCDMFRRCSNLLTAPEIPAVTLAVRCYYHMFHGCINLETPPKLPATTLADYCYAGMFRDCKSLTSVPELPATTLAKFCYSGMFDSCTSITKSSDLPATNLAEKCYGYMFVGCIRLIKVTMLANISNDDVYYYAIDMLNPVNSSGTFTKNPSANLTAGGGLIPSGWKVVDYAG